MRDLNQIGLQNYSLGITEHRQISLAKVIEQTAKTISSKLKGRPFQYIELGPEPIKTGFILDSLLKINQNIRRYIGVDINPVSENIMKKELSAFVPDDKIIYYNILFSNLQKAHIDLPNTVNLVTMLGFEEGNEHPCEIQNMLKSLLNFEDLFLSEMQLLPKGDWSPIFNFYRTKEMRNFSRITFKRVYPDVKSEYGVFLVPVFLESIGKIMVAITAERMVIHNKLDKRIFITNYCIKYTYEDFIKIRKNGGLKVICQRVTSDGAIAFQLSERA